MGDLSVSSHPPPFRGRGISLPARSPVAKQLASGPSRGLKQKLQRNLWLCKVMTQRLSASHAVEGPKSPNPDPNPSETPGSPPTKNKSSSKVEMGLFLRFGLILFQKKIIPKTGIVKTFWVKKTFCASPPVTRRIFSARLARLAELPPPPPGRVHWDFHEPIWTISSPAPVAKIENLGLGHLLESQVTHGLTAANNCETCWVFLCQC